MVRMVHGDSHPPEGPFPGGGGGGCGFRPLLEFGCPDKNIYQHNVICHDMGFMVTLFFMHFRPL